MVWRTLAVTTWRARAARARTSGELVPAGPAGAARVRGHDRGLPHVRRQGRARRGPAHGLPRRVRRARAPPVAVRSSATAEDLAERQLRRAAGHLPERPRRRRPARRRPALLGLAVDRRAVAYRARAGHRRRPTVRLAVVVQEMVEADAAGVMFTANPANGRRQETVDQRGVGPGRGRRRRAGGHRRARGRTPDGPVLSRPTADKAVHDRLRRRGTAERDGAGGAADAAVLDDAAAVELARLGAAVAATSARPQDIEWVRRDETFFLVQSRPITALPPPRRTRRPTGRCPSRTPCMSGPASSSSCPTR